MQTISDFVKENNLKVDVSVVNNTYVCIINGKDGKFEFSMTRERLLDHMKRFCSKDFVDAMINDERAIRTHFRRLAVTWWHIAVMSTERAMEIK